MFWTMAVVLIIFWMLWKVAGYEIGLFFNSLYAIAVVLLLVGINREVNTYSKRMHTEQGCNLEKKTRGVSAFEKPVPGHTSRGSLR